jgi:branched-chain amino acid transport system permease protein
VHVRRKAFLALTAIAALASALLIAFAGPAAAAGEAVFGSLKNEGKPVGGVKIVVTQADDAPVGEATSAPDGKWRVELPGPGQFKVKLDQETLPEGVTLRDEDLSEIAVDVRTNQKKPLLFALGKGERKTSGDLTRAWVLTIEGLRFGLVLALASLGLSVIYGTTGLTNFAHGEIVTFGALIAFFVNVTLELPFLVAAAIALVAGAAAGALQEVAFWRWLRRRGSGNIAMMIISIGLSLFLRYIYLLIFGGSSRSYRAFEGVRLEIGPAVLGQGDLLGIGLSAFFLALASWALLRTRMGKATRAVADNPALASASGIDVDRVINMVWIFGAALTALAGVLFGLSQQVNYEMGFGLLLLMFAAVTLGGLGTAFGAIVGSIVVGLFIQLSTLVIPSELKNVGALGVLIVILLVRPQGIFGRRERVG